MLTLMAVKLKWELESCIKYFLTRLVVTYCVFKFIANESSSSKIISLSVSLIDVFSLFIVLLNIKFKSWALRVLS